MSRDQAAIESAIPCPFAEELQRDLRRGGPDPVVISGDQCAIAELLDAVRSLEHRIAKLELDVVRSLDHRIAKLEQSQKDAPI